MMKRIGRWSLVAAALSATAAAGAQTPAPASAAPAEKPGSLYLQCDGKPNNMTAGESAARLLGAVTLLAVFAPPPEAYSPDKRKFGADGVAACTQILDGANKEGNPARRISLILARALHRIEDKQYEAAIADVGVARAEAKAAGFIDNPYWLRSEGRSFDQIEAAALFRLGRATEARDLSVRSAELVPHSWYALATLRTYEPFVRTGSPAEQAYLSRATRVQVSRSKNEADRLDELGRFADSARLRDANADFDRTNRLKAGTLPTSNIIAGAAIAYALAGDMATAAARAATARDNYNQRISTGDPDKNPSEFVEMMDLYEIIRTSAGSEVATARRLFAARSQWVAPSFGSVLEVTRRLRLGATPDELIGGLAKTPDALWQERADARRAELIAKDRDNKTLFYLLEDPASAGLYEAQSKRVWRTDKSQILLKPGKDNKSNLETLFLYGVDVQVAYDAYALHAALLARSRGHQGFTMVPIVTDSAFAAAILTGNRGEPGLADPLFNDAATVIADLSPAIPDPETLKARRATR